MIAAPYEQALIDRLRSNRKVPIANVGALELRKYRGFLARHPQSGATVEVLPEDRPWLNTRELRHVTNRANLATIRPEIAGIEGAARLFGDALAELANSNVATVGELGILRLLPVAPPASSSQAERIVVAFLHTEAMVAALAGRPPRPIMPMSELADAIDAGARAEPDQFYGSWDDAWPRERELDAAGLALLFASSTSPSM